MIGYVNTGNGASVGVEMWPEFKKPILVVKRGCEATKIASFNSDESVQMFFDALHDVFGVDHVKWEDDIRLEGKE